MLFCNYLKDVPDSARKYRQLKEELAIEHQYDREAYTRGKTRFVHEITQKAKDYYHGMK